LSDLQQSIKSQAQAQTLQNDAKAAQARLQTDGSDSSYAEVARLQQAQIDELKRERDDLKKWVLEQINAASEHALSDHSSEIDYALHSAGGTIVSRSATYRHPQSSFLAHVGAHVVDRLTRRESQHPIQISVLTPGECWPMKGSSGYVSIELSARIRITAAVVEHVSHKIAPHYSSAPRAMRLVGFESSSDAANEGAVGVVLGQFEYQSFGSMIQRFEIASSASSAKPFTAVRLEILSNHGNADYTCLYRVRIHGQPVA
jgi:SUN domain-containing protein 1/2